MKTTVIFAILFFPVFAFADDLSNDFTTIRGLVKPTTTAVLSSEIAAKIKQFPLHEGDSFKQGDVLVEFDCSYHWAQLAVAKAELEANNLQLENQQQLLKLSAGSKIEVDLSAVEVKKAKANVRLNNINASRCKIKAPYKGRVIETFVNQHESVGKDQELISILNDADLEIEVIVPSSWISWLEPGIEFDFTVDETGNTHKVKIKQIGAVVDPVSQTIPVMATFLDKVNVLSGMSGTASFQIPES